MSSTLWLTDTMSSCKDDDNCSVPGQLFTVNVYFPDTSAPACYEHVIDIVFNEGLIVLILKEECVYYRAKHVKKWTAVKEDLIKKDGLIKGTNGKWYKPED